MQLYILVSTDFKAHIFNECLILVKTMNMQSRLLQHIDFIDETNTLVACGIEGVFFYRLSYQGATDKKQQAKLDPLGTRLKFSLKLTQRLQGVTEWLKGFQVDREHNMLFAWSLKEASIYNLSDGSFYFSYHNLFN